MSISSQKLTFDLDHEAGSEAGPDTVEGGAEELPSVVGAHEDAGLGAVHRRLTNLQRKYLEQRTENI